MLTRDCLLERPGANERKKKKEKKKDPVAKRARTLFFVDPENHDDLIPPYPDELLDRSDTSARQFAQKNHPINVVVFQQFHIGAHLGNLFSQRDISI